MPALVRLLVLFVVEKSCFVLIDYGSACDAEVVPCFDYALVCLWFEMCVVSLDNLVVGLKLRHREAWVQVIAVEGDMVEAGSFAEQQRCSYWCEEL